MTTKTTKMRPQLSHTLKHERNNTSCGTKDLNVNVERHPNSICSNIYCVKTILEMGN